ncbi:siderophore-interacting protein [Pseudooceanicola sp. CBS1P-1]|uniref:Siderophore-interacting protein n=1 Tax=Pseudooceanicola albus TaxID=2692189 RepID=A0A6L7G9F8_9RHOB|nr:MULTISPECIES: siderophore-interacting protein [Pseudooceanicola]MBT9386566.1 siderophore-interacting protein [Pseudooceanicola endophyticus]MXN20599.1 siderophore-interacting protein [Pseudooceanicola albus]
MTHPHTATAQYSGPCPDDLLARTRSYLNGYDLPMEQGPDWVRMVLPRGTTTLHATPGGFRLEVAGEDTAFRHQLCEGAIFMIDQVCPEAAPAISWQGLPVSEGLPPGMHPARLRRITRLSPHFLRLEMDCPGTAELMEGGMHFTLLLPPEGRAPVWPALNDKGRTVWPAGADKLHRAVFTFVQRDPDTGWFSFDLYEHAGGPSSDWATRARPGDAVMVSGPGGGTAPSARHLLMAGDETALPAIRDILAKAAPGTTGEVLIETGDPADRLLEEIPEGFRLRWLDRTAGETLAPALAACPLTEPGLFLWVAGEAAIVREVRQRVQAEGALPRNRHYLAAYWSAPAA